MVKAFICDACAAYGKSPHAIVIRGENEAEICERCYDKIFNPPR